MRTPASNAESFTNTLAQLFIGFFVALCALGMLASALGTMALVKLSWCYLFGCGA